MEAERGDDPCRLGFQGMETERGDDPHRLGFQGMETESGDDPQLLEFRGVETERGDDLREAKRLKPSPAADAISLKSEEAPSPEMNVDVDRLDWDSVPSSEMDVDDNVVSFPYDHLEYDHRIDLYQGILTSYFEDVITISDQTMVAPAMDFNKRCVFSDDEEYGVEPDDYLLPERQLKLLLNRYKQMKHPFPYYDMVYEGGPLKDKEYLFLFCELKGDPEKYKQVLSEMELVMQWKRAPFESINCLYDSDDPYVPKSVAIAKRVIVENKLSIGLLEILECFWDLYTEWRLQKVLYGYKLYEEFLLNFWKKNKREPTPVETKETFCPGCFPKDEEEEEKEEEWYISPKFCTLTTCIKPASGKLCYRNLIQDVIGQALGAELLKGLEKGCSREGGQKIIDECYQKRLSKSCYCRGHILKHKLEEVVKSGLDTEIRKLFPSYDNIAIRIENLDIKVPIEQFDRSKRMYGL